MKERISTKLSKEELALIPKPKTFFMRVKCEKCGNQQVIFSAASRKIKCVACDHLLAEPGASKVNLKVKKFTRL